MKIYRLLSNAMTYLIEAALEVFSPDHDSYPQIGVQPFEGDVYLS